MKLKRRTMDRLKTEETTIITAGVQLNGMIKGTANILLHGVIEGDIEVSGTLVLGKGGKIRGDVSARNVVVEGEVEGVIRASEKAEIHEGGKCKGDIFTAMIAISENAYLEGNVKMIVEDGEPTIFRFKEKRRDQSEK